MEKYDLYSVHNTVLAVVIAAYSQEDLYHKLEQKIFDAEDMENFEQIYGRLVIMTIGETLELFKSYRAATSLYRLSKVLDEFYQHCEDDTEKQILRDYMEKAISYMTYALKEEIKNMMFRSEDDERQIKHEG
jgi:hypothetical protein